MRISYIIRHVIRNICAEHVCLLPMLLARINKTPVPLRRVYVVSFREELV